jgi:asparagine synthase (glutamine-hydrolysing)
MCGVCGELDLEGKTVRYKTLEGMCDMLVHRGPDDEGAVFFRDGLPIELGKPLPTGLEEKNFEVGLGHRRLSIIDLSEAAHQPMANEDGQIWVVYNGEIYNYQGLREQLEKKGHVFKSRSDTEVILHAYEEWGVECLNRFRGMFAFGLWDNRVRRLFLARDRLGKKPLVYSQRNGRFAFASEIKALLQVPWVERRVNPLAIHHYLTYQYIPSPETIFQSINKLPPAHYLLCDSKGHIRVERYWKLDGSAEKKSPSDLEGLSRIIKEKLEESVKLRLISDVPLGAFLSGGIDSSLIVGIMAKNGGPPVKTFSIGFEEQDFSELTYARLVAKHFATDHNEFVVRPDAIEILPKLVWYYNEPFGDSSAIPTYYVSKMTSNHVKVVLTGDAGDENFAGYPRYLRSKYVSWFTQLPEKLRRKLLPDFLRLLSISPWRRKTLNRLADFMEMLSPHQGRNYAEQIKIFNEMERKSLYTEEFLREVIEEDPLDYLIEKYEEADTKDPLEKLLFLDMTTYLPEDLLVKVDIATMANSLEARVPFLDHELVEEVAKIPFRLKLRGSTAKYILKKAYSDFLPETILKRKKMGFGVPLARWFRKELKEFSREILLDPQTLGRGYFKKEGIERMLDDHTRERYDHSAKIWALLFLEMWFGVFVDKGVNLISTGNPV